MWAETRGSNVLWSWAGDPRTARAQPRSRQVGSGSSAPHPHNKALGQAVQIVPRLGAGLVGRQPQRCGDAGCRVEGRHCRCRLPAGPALASIAGAGSVGARCSSWRSGACAAAARQRSSWRRGARAADRSQSGAARQGRQLLARLEQRGPRHKLPARRALLSAARHVQLQLQKVALFRHLAADRPQRLKEGLEVCGLQRRGGSREGCVSVQLRAPQAAGNRHVLASGRCCAAAVMLQRLGQPLPLQHCSSLACVS